MEPRDGSKKKFKLHQTVTVFTIIMLQDSGLKKVNYVSGHQLKHLGSGSDSYSGFD
ncbi:hypothetical protein NC651_028882 [Populus alba x Populus x berolinensis]|nr:hypothetical protein NC651_028882 [Populus alba x Populus x berolinensis]